MQAHFTVGISDVECIIFDLYGFTLDRMKN